MPVEEGIGPALSAEQAVTVRAGRVRFRWVIEPQVAPSTRPMDGSRGTTAARQRAGAVPERSLSNRSMSSSMRATAWNWGTGRGATPTIGLPPGSWSEAPSRLAGGATAGIPEEFREAVIVRLLPPTRRNWLPAERNRFTEGRDPSAGRDPVHGRSMIFSSARRPERTRPNPAPNSRGQSGKLVPGTEAPMAASSGHVARTHTPPASAARAGKRAALRASTARRIDPEGGGAGWS